jgi:fluoride exporter
VITAVAFLAAASAGAVGRFVLGHALNRPAFPTGTLVVNVSGSFALGLLAGLDAPALTIVGTGLLGAFTTFSSFARDVVALAEEHRWVPAAAYLLLSCTMTVAAAAAGLALA